MCRLTFFYITDAKVFPCPSKEVRANQQKALQGLIQGKCLQSCLWFRTEMTYNAHLRVLNYHTIVLTPYLHTCGLPHVKIVVFHIIKSFCPSRLPLVTHVCCLQHQSCKLVDTAAQILRNSKKQQKVHLAPVVGYMDNIYLFQFDWNYSDINPS